MASGDSWYYLAEDQRQIGPMEFSALQGAARAGRFGRGDYVWHEGDADWTLAERVPGLFDGTGGAFQPVGQPAAATVVTEAGEPVPQWFVGYAGFWLRFVAYILDGILLAIVMLLLSPVTGVTPGSGTDNERVVMLVLGWLYYATMESSPMQGTLGKLAVGIKVTDMVGERVSFLRASGRYWAKLLSTLTLMIGYIMAAFTPRRQALHDMIAQCLVVKRSSV